jgi:hypothetical protein
MICGSGDDHCCWIVGGVCPFLRDDGVDASRRWVCTLREQLGSWKAVHRDHRYVEKVAPTMRRFGVECGEWPQPGARCEECGVTG